MLSTVKGIVFPVSVPGAQTELDRGAFMASALSQANSLGKDFEIEKAKLSVVLSIILLFLFVLSPKLFNH